MTTQPEWLQRDDIKLPSWAQIVEGPDKYSVAIEVDTDGYIEDWFTILEVSHPDQYWLEVAYQCAKLDLQMAIAGSKYDPRTSGKPANFHFKRSEKWTQKKYPAGKGPNAATQGREAREHYRRIRGRLPM